MDATLSRDGRRATSQWRDVGAADEIDAGLRVTEGLRRELRRNPNEANRAALAEVDRLVRRYRDSSEEDIACLSTNCMKLAKCAIYAIDSKGYEVSKVLPSPSGEAALLRFNITVYKRIIDLQATTASWQWIVIDESDERTYHKESSAMDVFDLLDTIEETARS